MLYIESANVRVSYDLFILIDGFVDVCLVSFHRIFFFCRVPRAVADDISMILATSFTQQRETFRIK